MWNPNKSFYAQSIGIKLLMPLVTAVVSLLTIIHAIWVPKFLSDQDQMIGAQESAYIEALGISLVPSLLASDLAQIHATLDSIKARKPNWKLLRLTTAEGKLLYPLFDAKQIAPLGAPEYLVIKQAINVDSELLAQLLVHLDVTSQLKGELEHLTTLEMYLVLFSLLVTIFAAMMLNRWIRRPLKEIVNATERIIEGDFTHTLSQNSRDEVGQLVASVNKMQTQLDERQKESMLQNRILQLIANAQSRFIRDTNPQQLFTNLLSDILTLTNSEFGLIGEVLFDDDNPYFNAFAKIELLGSQSLQGHNDKTGSSSREINDLENILANAIEQREYNIVNWPNDELLSEDSNRGRSNFASLLVIPLKRQNKVIGMFGIANRPGGYNDTLVGLLKPIVNTCTQLVEAYKAEQNRLRIEKLEHEREVRMRTIVNNISEGIVTTSESGIIEGFNPAAENIFGYGADELIGHNISILVPDDHRNQHDGYIQNYFQTGESRIVNSGREVQGKRKNGSVFPLELTVSKIWVENQPLFCGVMRDNTERNKLNRMKDEFVSTVSHELRTPLTSIRGSLGMLASGMLGKFSAQVNNLLKIAVNNSERLLLLINDLLDMEKLASGNIVFDFQAIELVSFLQNVLESNQGYAEQQGVNFVLSDCDPELVIRADRNRFTQVLSNLLSNAAKFSPQGSNVETAAAICDGKVRITVTDRGCGIPEEFAERIFERFTQADSSSTRMVGGTGLGLNIAKAIVERHNGSLGYMPNPLGGTIFYVDLPIQETTANQLNTTDKQLKLG